MTPEQHLAKARSILEGLARLDPTDDTLALIDGTMIAGYHLGNAALHRHRVTEESVHFNTPSKLEMPMAALPSALTPAYDAFAALENLRSTYVRSPHTPDAEVGREAQRLMRAMARACGIEDA